jgi:hypothetical protein
MATNGLEAACGWDDEGLEDHNPNLRWKIEESRHVCATQTPNHKDADGNLPYVASVAGQDRSDVRLHTAL